MKLEIETIKERNVWHLEKLPQNHTPVGCRWVYAIKKDEKGRIAKYKARLVAQGFKQIPGDSFEETYSPVVNFSVIRFLFSLLVSFLKWPHTQLDVTSAYLYAPLQEIVYMKQPQGFEEKGKEHLHCRLDKALYGLHQSGRVWYFEIDKVLHNLGFKNFESCNCVYILNGNIILALYVDDIVIFGKNQHLINEAIKLLQTKFKIKILGRTRKLLGIEFEDSKTGILIHQHTYINEILNRFNKYKIPISSLPISKNVVYSRSDCPKTPDEINEIKDLPYRSIIGCLSFLASRTRPDIAYAVNLFSQFQSNPGYNHWNGLLKLLGYVQYTHKLKLSLNCTNYNISVFSDADFASNKDDRTSMSGQIALLGNSPISWRSAKQKNVSLSTMESEFVALTDAAKEMIWLDRILDECVTHKLIKSKIKTKLLVDNQSAIFYVKSPIENLRNKYFATKVAFIRNYIYEDKCELLYVKSKENLSDIFTKPPTKTDLQRFNSRVYKELDEDREK